jgi:GNAT superfamily N-acetyltransferase
MNDLEIDFKPTKEHLNTIKAWLIEEREKSGEGFFCNWEVITDAFAKKTMVLIYKSKSPIGFLTWFDWGAVTTIQIAEIKPGLRRMGYGRLLAEFFFSKMTQQGVVALNLHCQPTKSEKVWKKLGFKEYPNVRDFEDFHDEDGKHLYKILVPHLKPSSPKENNERIELWSVEPYQTTNNPPLWQWYPKFEKNNRTLVKPIIFPGKRDWNIRWTKEGKIMIDDKVKRFGKMEIDFCNFIIITQLPLKDGKE